MDALLADGSEKPKTAQESKDSCTVFVRNLPFEWTDTNLHTTFEDIGPIKRAFIVVSKHHARKYDQKERDSGGSRGFGFVQFAVENDAIRAVSEMNGKEIQGRKIKVERAAKKGTKKEQVVKMKKQEKQQEKKQEKPKKVIITPTPTPTPATDGQDSETSDDEDETPKRPQQKQQQQQQRVKHDDDDDVESDDDDEMDRDSSDEEEEKQPTKPASKSTTPTSTSTSKPTSQPASKPTSTTSSRTLLLSGLPMHTTEAEIRAVASQHGTIKQLIYPSPESTTKHHACRIEYDTSSSASHAHTSLSNHQFHSTKIRCIYLDDTKSARLIIRNLPFNITEAYLRKQLNKTCPDVVVTEIKIPTDANGKVRGFGFLSCNDLDDAVRVMTRLNGTSIMSRPIAVDWALAKNDYESRATVAAKKAAMERVKVEEEKKKQDATTVTETKENAEEDKSEDEKSDDEQSEDDEKDDDKDDEDDEDDSMEDDSEDDGPDDDDIDVDAQHSEESSDDEEKDDTESKKPTFNDVQNGSTIFIRNLAYDTTNDELYEKFRTFGGVKVVKIVMDKEMNRPKGTAFVQFYKPETAQKVLNTVNSNANLSLSQRTNKNLVTSALNPNAIQLGGRALIISLAVDRNEATRLTTVAEKQRDKRNLYLAKEGAIAPDSDAAEGLSKSDLAKRAKAAKEKREKLKNPNYMISQTRLSVRNLPPEYDEKQLKKLFLDTVKKQVDVNVAKQTAKRGTSTAINPHVRQVKIVRDKERIEGATGLGRSKKYGFVEFEQHEHALMALRALNNNPMVWGKDRRPIIEFALEDHRKLLLRKKQQAAIQHRLLNQEKSDAKTTTSNDKKRKATESDSQSNKKQKTNDKTVTKPTPATKPTTSNKPSQPAKTSDKPVKPAKPAKPTKQSPASSKPTTQPTSKPATASSKKESKSSTSPATVPASAPKTKSALKRERAASSTDRLSKRAKKEWEAEKSFDSMVDAYKKKLFQAPVEQIKTATSRWYE